MFITEAFAQTPGAGGAGGLLNMIVPMVMVFGIMYFLLIRPQQKKLKDHRDMIGALRRGDTVVTGGGIVGKVTKVIGDAELQVEVAEGVRIRVLRGTIAEVRTRGDVRDVEARRALARDDDDAEAPDNDNQQPPAKKGKPATAAVGAGDGAEKDV